jgi:DNA-binding NarL/FixJ family response regulator
MIQQARRNRVVEPARLLLADDHDAARASLRSLLSRARGLEIVGEASNGREAVDLFQRLRPDLLLVDVHMPVLDGLGVTRFVKEESPSTRVMIVTLDATPSRLLEALKAGANAYVLKGSSKRLLLDVVRQVLKHQTLLQTELAVYLLETLQTGPDVWTTVFLEPLTPIELGILRLCADGRSRGEIGRALELEQLALSSSIQRVLTKLGVVTQ